jgi:SpoIID/LytB domain protein
MKRGLFALLAVACALGYVARADDMSGDDKLAALYRHRFTFTPEGLPLLTIELMHGQTSVRISGAGLRVFPDGDGGPTVRAGDDFTITARETRPARMRYHTIVSRHATEADVALWRGRGYSTKTFETGVVFGVKGDVLDSRELLLGVAPEVDEAAGTRAAAALAKRWGVATFVHPELVDRPRGVLTARDAASGAVVENASVLWFAPGSEDVTLTVWDVVHGGGGSQPRAEKRETRTYFGQIYVTLGKDATLTVVNAVPEDRLLAGLVPSEIFPDAPFEALKAQTVAARDDLLAKIGTRHFAEPFLLCSTQHCQVYGGAGHEDARTTRAVRETRGEVLFKQGLKGDSQLVQAYYSASCGGHGEHNESIWGTPPDDTLRGHLDLRDAKALPSFKRGVTDANVRAFLALPESTSFCGQTRYGAGRFRWKVTRSAAEMDALVAAAYPEVGSVKDIAVLSRGISGRIKSLTIAGDKARVTVDGELKIRKLFGGLKSSLFALTSTSKEAKKTSWVFDGAGFGHGVGLCQTGAIGMAESGDDYRKILEHYYPKSRVTRLY